MSNATGAPTRSLRLNTVVTAGSSVLRGLLGFAASLVITRSLSTDARGTYSFTTNATSLVVMIAGVGVPSALTRAKAQGRTDIPTLYRASWLLGITTGVTAGAVFLLVYLARPGNLFTGVRPGVALLIASIIPLMIVLTYWTVVAYLDDRLVEFGLATVLASVLMLVAVTALALVGSLNGLSVIIVWAITTLVPVLILARRPQILGAWKSRRIARELLHFGLKANVATVALILTWRLDVFFVKGLRGARELAYYVVAVGIAEIILQVAVSFRVALTPLQGSAANRDRLVQTIIALTRVTVWAGAIGASLLIIFSHPLIVWLFGARYAASTSALVWLAPGVVALVAQGPLIDYLLSENKLQRVTHITLTALIINVVLNVTLLRNYDFVVAAVASTAAYTISFIACIVLFARHIRMPVSYLVIPRMADVRFLMGRR